MEIPQCLKDAGVTEEQLEEMLEPMADAAPPDRCTATNPKPSPERISLGCIGRHSSKEPVSAI